MAPDGGRCDCYARAMTCPADTRGHDAIELAVFASRITAVCEEMGARLAQAHVWWRRPRMARERQGLRQR